MNPFRLLVCLSLLCLPAFADAQEVGDSSFSRLNTFSVARPVPAVLVQENARVPLLAGWAPLFVG